MHNVVLFSGGLDSTALLNHVAQKRDGPKGTLALHIRYESDHNPAERTAAIQIARVIGVEFQVAYLAADIFKGAGSTLMGEGEIPNGEYREDGPQSTVIPFRNGLFISVATAVASRYDNAEVWIATHSDDGKNWAYPDCRPEFMEAMAEAVNISTLGNVQLVVPYQYLTKADIVERAALEAAPLGMTYSCYRGGDIHCGTCATCVDRQKAFAQSEYIDPTTYKEVPREQR